MLQNPPKWKMMSTPNSENIFSMFNSVTKRYHCLRCNKTCETRSGLRQHYQSHIGKFSYWCEVCAKGFTGKSHFDARMAKHEGRTFSLILVLSVMPLHSTFAPKRLGAHWTRKSGYCDLFTLGSF